MAIGDDANRMERGSGSGQRATSSETVPGWHLLEVLGVLTSFRNNVEKFKLYKASISLIKFLSILNMTYTLVGLIFLILAMFPNSGMRFNMGQRQQFMKLGIFISIFSPLALCCDLLALRGLRQWKRKLLLPWIIVYAVLIALSFSVAISETFHRGIRWQLILLALCSFCILSGWRHVRVQYALMAIDPHPPSEATIEQLADEIRVVATNVNLQNETSELRQADPLPPKYEDLEQPPKYEDHAVNKPEGGATNQSG